MELKEFIKRSLLDVVNAVDEANQEKNRFRLNSHVTAGSQIGQKIEFDITAIVDESHGSETNGAIKVAVLSFGGGVTRDLKESKLNHHTHKIKFEIFVTENNSSR